MRSHSGRDESRNTMRDPTVPDRAMQPKAKKSKPNAKARTTEMGSHARKSGQEGRGAHR